MSPTDLTAADREQLRARAISSDEIERQLALFRKPRRFTRLVRPCTVGDGIRRIREDEVDELLVLHRGAVEDGRFSKFVPASGAATRMFRDLLVYQKGPRRSVAWPSVVEQAHGGDLSARTLVAFMEELQRFAFWNDLQTVAGPTRAGEYLPVLDALLETPGLGYEKLPKGLLNFHSYPERARTPFEEQLVEARDYAFGEGGLCRLHFTVSPEHLDRFEALFREVREFYESRFDARYEVAFSVQKSSTDTLAVDPENRPFRDDGGRLVFRPGGHGALIENLNDLGADLVYIKNIDNVQPDDRRPPVSRWKRILGGYLIKLQRRGQEILGRLRDDVPPQEFLDQALGFAATRLQLQLNGRFDSRSPEARRRWLLERLSRPIRVCGVVPNTGEPGGGPFWVRERDGSVTLQIIETAQVDLDDPEQRSILAGSTHFNPVDLVCGLRDGERRPYDLDRFIDHDAVIVTEKSHAGRDLKALERPGLWNGAMAEWNTVFVETPLESFTPVKTVLDLLRPEHGAEWGHS
jgi:hypothetical protein